MKSKHNRKPREITRAATITVSRAQKGGGFPVVISTDAPLPGRHAAREVLEHQPGAVNLERVLKSGLPVKIDHERGGLPVARARDLEVSDGVMRGVIHVGSARPELASDLEEGIITDVSVRAQVDEWDELEDGTLVARQWTPLEVSLVTMGEDPNTQVVRGKGAGKDEADRREEIQRMFQGLEGQTFQQLERAALYSDDSVDVIRGRLDGALRSQLKELQAPTGGQIQAGADSLDKWFTGVERSLDFRCDVMAPDDARSYARELQRSEFASMSLLEIARDYLRRRNLATHGDASTVVARALSTPAAIVERAIFSHTTSDFSNLLAGSADKALAKGFDEHPETYGAFASDVPMSNFREHSFNALSTFGDLDQIPDTGDFKYGTFSDKKESMTLASYGKLFSIGRQAIINDDLNAFSRVPGHMGRAARRKVGDLVYAVITANGTMAETSRALFNTTDTTLAASGGVISTTTLDAGRTAMAKQTDPAGNVLNLRPAILLVPVALETKAKVQVASEKDPGTLSGRSEQAPNPFQGAFTVVSDARLDANSATAWYLMAAKSAGVEGIAVGWLNNVQRPRLEQETGFEKDGIAYKVAIDCTAGALDYRGSYKNAGA